jgi:hypothetical protein
MIAPAAKPERFLGSKELPDALAAAGLERVNSEWDAQRLIKAMRETGAPVACRYTVRASDAVAWILAHPEWSPRSSTRRAAGLFSLPT